jgi:DUF4097 and DUF4098 domain-containing protein YvlB
MILKMLQEGKISVDEANALLDVLNEPQTEEPGGFSKADATSPGAARGAASSGPGEEPGRWPDGPGPVPREPGSDTGREGAGGYAGGARAEHAGRERGGNDHGAHGPHDRGVHVDFDFSGLKESLRTTMGSVRDAVKGVSESLRDAFEGLSEFDITHEFGRAMGRVRSDDERELGAEVGSSGTLRISNAWGDVRVTGGETASVSGTARITCWAADEERSRAAVDATQIRLEQVDGEWLLESDPGQRHATRIDYELEVPSGYNVVVSSASGDLWLEDLSGSQTVNTMSGDINVASLGSETGSRQIVSTKSGDVIGAALVGDVTLNSLSGDVSVNGFTGVLRVSTQSGDIDVADGSGSVQLKTMSGDIQAALLAVGDEPIRLTTVSGDAELTVPEGASVDIEARSTSGDADVGFELEDAERTEHRVAGTANGGALRVELSSVSGDVEVNAG